MKALFLSVLLLTKGTVCHESSISLCPTADKGHNVSWKLHFSLSYCWKRAQRVMKALSLSVLLLKKGTVCHESSISLCPTADKGHNVSWKLYSPLSYCWQRAQCVMKALFLSVLLLTKGTVCHESSIPLCPTADKGHAVPWKLHFSLFYSWQRAQCAMKAPFLSVLLLTKGTVCHESSISIVSSLYLLATLICYPGIVALT